MNPTDVRETLTAVSTSVPVPAPDTAAFEARVTRTRRRRTTGRVLAAAACVAVVALGASLLPRTQPTAVAPAGRPDLATASAATVPVVVDGRLRALAPDGSLSPAGPAVATVVGPRPGGVVTFLADGSLAEVAADGTVTVLVDAPVRTAYLDGDSVLYETYDGRVRRVGDDTVVARTDGGRLMAAGDGIYVTAGPDGLVAHDAAGDHALWLGEDVTTVRQVRVGGDTVSVVTEDQLQVLDADGARSAATPGDAVGALAPDGSAYARPTADRRGVELLDTTSLVATPVAGLSGAVREVAFTSDGDLLVVTSGQRLWRCDTPTSCDEVLSGQGPVRLR